MDVAQALNHIVAVEKDWLIVDNKEAANELSQVYIDAKNYGGSITGPYLQPVNGEPKKVYYIQKY